MPQALRLWGGQGYFPDHAAILRRNLIPDYNSKIK
jgi:hypothetical protein